MLRRLTTPKTSGAAETRHWERVYADDIEDWGTTRSRQLVPGRERAFWDGVRRKLEDNRLPSPVRTPRVYVRKGALG